MPSSSQHGFRRAIEALKDSTMVGLARVNSGQKEVEIAVVKATDRKEEVPKEKHVRSILAASGNRYDAAFCIHTLLKRLSKTRTWTVALKSLIIIHRILRHDPSFHQELVNIGRERGLLLNVSHLRTNSSPETWNYSSWVQEYALYLEERSECYNVLKYDVDKDQSRNGRLDTPDLLDQLPVLQELLGRLLNCKPVGSAFYSHLIHYVLSIIAGESVKLYIAITDGVLNLVDKYFEMQRDHALRALEIYKKAGEQASQLSEFFEICRGLHYGQGQKYLKINPLPESFLIAMEEYVKDTPEVLALPYYTSVEAEEGAPPTESPAPVPDLLSGDNQDDGARETSDASSNQASSDTRKAVATLDIGDLISFDEPSEETSELIDNNPRALAIFESENPPFAENVESSAPASTGWELALCGSPTSNGAAVADNQMTGGSNGLTPQSLLATNQQMAFNFSPVSANPFGINYNSQDPFFGSSYITPQTNVQMSAMPQHPIYFMQQRPPMAMADYHSLNPSVMANYNQVPTFNGCSNTTPSIDMTLATMTPQQTKPTQQPTLDMVGYNPPKPSGNPFDM
ncbi:putative clathrin assembly protein At5g35200 [Hibiscus syriacus]|uniref:putative clathrin assembly protein At5g35200 n=1 Tax=Hibiscus syriacus TaxID=106335 RepID=UPI001924B593|nr:putative clathrin assembly protein At5g35200 [Hibiscus syriacus]